jgi:alcohol dehydrogenase/propanol-preferring alcohol dehydrogenase
MGYRTIAISSTEDKRKAAMTLGAHRFINAEKEDLALALKEEGGASLIINFVPQPEM